MSKALSHSNKAAPDIVIHWNNRDDASSEQIKLHRQIADQAHVAQKGLLRTFIETHSFSKGPQIAGRWTSP
jgi:hypothetical protein